VVVDPAVDDVGVNVRDFPRAISDLRRASLRPVRGRGDFVDAPGHRLSDGPYLLVLLDEGDLRVVLHPLERLCVREDGGVTLYGVGVDEPHLKAVLAGVLVGHRSRVLHAVFEDDYVAIRDFLRWGLRLGQHPACVHQEERSHKRG
jgi:hypothetical protein